MNILSLFDGMSCGQIAAERAGLKIDNYFASEIEKDAIFVAKKNYPNTIHLGCVKTVIAKDLPEIDLLIGGSPCQSFSIAGNGLGFDGKSQLFWEYVRLLKEVKPKFFLLENVVMKKEWQNVISNALNVEPVKINSSLVSAQNRPRLYWTNIKGVEQPLDKKILLKDILLDNVDKKFFLSEKAFEYMERERQPGKKRWEFHTNFLDGKAACLTANMFKGIPYGVIKELGRRLSPEECEILQTVPVGYTSGVSNTQRFKMIGNGWTVDVISHILKNINNIQK